VHRTPATRRDGKTIQYSFASEEARVVVGAVYEVFCGKSPGGQVWRPGRY
jgi:hypothetical protein